MKYIVLCLSILSCDAGSAISQIRRSYDNALLRSAVKRGELKGVQESIASGADVHFDNDFALRWAAKEGYLDIVLFLLTELPEGQRADVHALDDEALRGASSKAVWYSEHSIAVSKKYWNVVVCLLQHGADRTKLTTEQEEQMRNSSQAHQYILAELRIALHCNDWYAVEQLLDILPMQELPETIQQSILNRNSSSVNPHEITQLPREMLHHREREYSVAELLEAQVRIAREAHGGHLSPHFGTR